MTAARSNIVLIGMPGAGKSTVGSHLAERLGLGFTDTDALIETDQGVSLQAIVDQQGHQSLRTIEAALLAGLVCERHVIATGGSAVYNAEAMAALRHHGVIVHLHVELAVIAERVHNFESRGIARAAGQTLAELYSERETLYQQYAEISVDLSEVDEAAAAPMIEQALSAAHLLPPALA
jgi:shikimate kinase (EC 2.7.1.71)